MMKYDKKSVQQMYVSTTSTTICIYAHIITTWVDETCVLIYRPGIDRNRESLAILNTERIHADVGITT